MAVAGAAVATGAARAATGPAVVGALKAAYAAVKLGAEVANQARDAIAAIPANATNFVVTKLGDAIAIPSGARGPLPANSGTGMVSQGGVAVTE